MLEKVVSVFAFNFCPWTSASKVKTKDFVKYVSLSIIYSRVALLGFKSVFCPIVSDSELFRYSLRKSEFLAAEII